MNPAAAARLRRIEKDARRTLERWSPFKTAFGGDTSDFAAIKEVDPTVGSVLEVILFHSNLADSCVQAKALFPACVFATAALESWLILACISDDQRVRKSRAYRCLPPKTRRLSSPQLAYALSLKELLSLGSELKWFHSPAVISELKTYVGSVLVRERTKKKGTLSEIDKFFLREAATRHIGSILGTMVRGLRDAIHPGRLLREDWTFIMHASDENLGAFLLAIRELIDSVHYGLALRARRAAKALAREAKQAFYGKA